MQNHCSMDGISCHSCVWCTTGEIKAIKYVEHSPHLLATHAPIGSTTSALNLYVLEWLILAKLGIGSGCKTRRNSKTGIQQNPCQPSIGGEVNLQIL